MTNLRKLGATFAVFFVLMFTPNHFSSSAYADYSVLSKASSFIGLHERSNRQKIKSVTKVDPVRTPWCAAFVNGILRSKGKSGTGSNTARSFTKYKTGTRNPKQGDVVVIRRKGGSGAHVGFFKGFVTKNGKRYVAVLGGNQSNKVSVSHYPTSKVISYRSV